MVKLALGKALEQRKATCNFCGENNKDCVRGSVPLEATRYTFVEQLHVPKDSRLVFPFLRENFYRYTEYDLIPKYEESGKVTDDADICVDCIRQLASLIRK